MRAGCRSLDREGKMTTGSTARVPTKSGRKYAQQLANHWSHNMKVERTPEGTSIIFPRNARGADWPADGIVILSADSDALNCRIEASAAGQLDGIKGALAHHLDRFAFREAPLSFAWEDD